MQFDQDTNIVLSEEDFPRAEERMRLYAREAERHGGNLPWDLIINGDEAAEVIGTIDKLRRLLAASKGEA